MHKKKVSEKRCPMCDKIKKMSDFGRDSSRPDGRYTYCKSCRLKPNTRWEEENELFGKNLKKCSKCDKIKPVTSFDSDKTKRLGLASSCKACTQARRKQKHSDWHANKETLEHLFSKGKSKCTKCNAVKPLNCFLKSNRTKFGIYRTCKDCSTKYRKNRDPSIRDYVVWDVYTEDNFVCYLCDEPVDINQRHPHPKSPSIDHVHPLSRGGLDIRENVRLACWNCNKNKRNMFLDEYFAKFPGPG